MLLWKILHNYVSNINKSELKSIVIKLCYTTKLTFKSCKLPNYSFAGAFIIFFVGK